MQKIIAILWHLIPILPLASGSFYGTLAAVFLVALPYIKVKKMTIQLSEVGDESNVAELSNARKRWQYLTLNDFWSK